MIYLDYNATTPCAPEVLDAMLPYFGSKFGNAGSVTHSMGWIAQEAVKNARQQIASFLQCEAEEIYFTSGATESCNLAIQGIFDAYQVKGKEIITCATEHKAVLDTYHFLESKGAIVKILPVDENGHIDIEELERQITAHTILISIMLANNETGTVHNIEAIGTIARKHQVIFFCDATQAIGKTSISLATLPVDAVAFSAHKMYGPKGIGGLFLRRKKPRVLVSPMLYGGGQEKGKRSGTLNVPGIVGMAKAFDLAKQDEWLTNVQQLRDHLEARILSLHPNFRVNGALHSRLPHVSNIAICGIKAEKLLSKVNHELCFSLGSACAAAQQGPSHVLQAMYTQEERINGAIRISLGRYTTESEIHQTIEILSKHINELLPKF